MLQLVFLIYISCHGTFHGHCTDITELFIDWWTHDQSQQSNLRPTFVIIILRVVLLNLDMFLLTNMVLSKGSLKMPRATILRCFHFILLIRLFFGSTTLKRVERSRTAELKDFQADFLIWKSSTLERHSSLHDHNWAAFIVKSFLPEVISRSQLSQNTFKNCSGEGIRAWISVTLAYSKFFLLLLYELKKVKTQLEYYCYNSFPHKTFRIRRAWSWNFYWGLVLAVWRNTYDERQLIMKYQTWNVTAPNAIQISNGKQEANNKEFKAKRNKAKHWKKF